MVYKKTEIAAVIDYARDRGVRIIPEFDVPGKANVNPLFRFLSTHVLEIMYLSSSLCFRLLKN